MAGAPFISGCALRSWLLARRMQRPGAAAGIPRPSAPAGAHSKCKFAALALPRERCDRMLPGPGCRFCSGDSRRSELTAGYF